MNREGAFGSAYTKVSDLESKKSKRKRLGEGEKVWEGPPSTKKKKLWGRE